METQPFTRDTYLARHLHALRNHAYCECELCLEHNRGVAAERSAKREKLRLERIERNREFRGQHEKVADRIVKALAKLENKDKRRLLRVLAEEVA